MEQHPVPQNVTTFQFRLIGDMTLKQFGYLCAGGILAFIAYKLPLPFFFTWPGAVGFALLGIGFAFVPIEERPMDVWVFSFFKSIYSPTQYVWSNEVTQKPQPKSVSPKAVAQTHQPIAQQSTGQAAGTHSILSGLFGQATQPTQTKTQTHQAAHILAQHKKPSLFEQLTNWMNAKPKPTPHVAAAPVVMPTAPSVTGKHAEPVKQEVAKPKPALDQSHIQQEVSKLEGTVHALESELAAKTATGDRIVELQKQLTDVMSERSRMEEELVTLKRQIVNPPKPIIETSSQSVAAPVTQQPTQPTVSLINTQAAAVKVGLPRLTTTPNVITGIIKDGTNNFLPAILVTVINRQNIPMRALKTNKLGQFAASTPLPNDTYIIEAEDPRKRFTFDRVQITLGGGVVPAIEVIAKSQKQLVREQLAQEIFGKNQL